MEYRETSKKNYINQLSKLAFIPLIILIILLMLKFKIALNGRTIKNFSAIFISIILEAMPFIFIGSLISSFIQLYVSEKTIARILPKNKFLALLSASVIGIFFPICECAIIPIARRLIKKGVPVGVATTFMLATPIINPVVLMSTYYAFNHRISILFIRSIAGIIAAIAIGSIISILERNNSDLLREDIYDDNDDLCGCGESHTASKNKSKLSSLLDNVISEFFDISKFLIFGAILSAVFQVLVSRDSINVLARNPYISVLAMIGLAFILSICSEADAFIGSTFVGQFTTGSIIAFLIFGPMLDIKNTLMLVGGFKRKYVITLIISIVIICFILGSLVNFIEIMKVI
ncbi:permease [Clostridium fungisolvens]|uniref:Two-component membrane permease complex subunit SMU_747c n=1 Tax=Clostridium fungisolvens TaxID=1604897 RepID=A0A6V8SNG3_9CLOT|nr:permease [Clostridium fungisolvens]GFP78145.1 Putative two-component membrane permease complex subunit SMU_747c [Clostridium fungisolvens]